MAEYISREAVEQVLCGIANGLSVGEAEALKVKGVKALYKMQGAKEILNAVDNDLSFIPAADVQPVRHGRWEQIGEQSAKCTACGGVLKSNGKDKTGKALIFNAVYHYCPYCGARMDGAAE